MEYNDRGDNGVQMTEVRESHTSCNEFEETLARAVCEEVLLEREKTCGFLTSMVHWWAT